ncbi:unnamed protein product [Urochloa decumbens]|uniref:BURP domain-containing protein n=1 Tax=Urochloa decumbens TaxID=240449 RepID=A0ABC9DFN8_9POAL
MDAIVSLVILLLVSEAGASKHADRPTGLAVTSPRTMAPMEYWQAVLPETPIPKAIHDLLTQSTGQASKDNKGATQGHNIGANHSQGKIFSKGPHKVRKEDEVEMQMQISNPQFEDHKKVLILKGVNNHILLYGPKGKEDLGKISTSYGPQVDEDVRKVTALYGSQHEKDLRKISTSYGPQGEENLKKISTSYGSQGEEELRKISTSYGSQGEEDLRKVTASYGSQHEEDLRKISTSYGPQGEEDLRKVTASYGSQHEEDLRKISTSYASQGEDDLRKISTSYGPQVDEDVRKVTTLYGSQHEEDLRKISTSYGHQGQDDLRKISTSYGSQGEEDLRKVSTSYGSKHEEDLRKISTSYGAQGEEDLRKISTSYGSQGGEEDLRKMRTSYGSQGEEDLRKISTSYGSEGEEELRKISTSYESQGEEDLRKISTSYGSHGDKDLRKINTLYGSQGDKDSRKISTSYGSQGDEGLRKINTLYGSQGDEDLRKISTSYGSRGEYLRKINTSYGPQGDNDLKKISTSYGSKGEDNSLKITVFDNQQIASKKVEASKEHMHNHVHSHNDNGNKVADVFFFHDVLRPGSMITPIIPPTTSLPTLLPRHEANSLPFSTKRLDDILAMFTPASRAMADEIRWTLDTCEHPRPVPGENAGCATSLESLAKLPAALLGTRNVRAISGDMPVDPAGTMARRGRYNVTAVQKLSESPVAAVCHDLTYPYAVFYCHTTNPTAAYLVTLEAEDSAAPAMEALAVCHLDTSQWSPRQPFLVAHNLRPGDVAVCHFLSKLSIVWVPAEEQGGVRAAL